VHNIVLYPEKHSWCQTTPIQQVVASPGYEPVTIDNNVCVGACYSYSIPKTQPAEPGELIGPYCDSCQPSEMKCYHVNLRADDKNADGAEIIQKRVQIIMNCSCQSCDKVRKEDCEITDENTLELPQNLYTDEKSNKSTFDEAPDLLNNAPSENNTQHVVHNTKTEIHLKNLKKWFETYQKNQTDELRSDEETHPKYQKPSVGKYYRIDIDPTQDNNIKIEKDLENLPPDFGLEGVPSHHKGNHIGMGMQHSQNDIIVEDLAKKHHDAKSVSSGNHHAGHHPGYHHGEAHHVHHLGEEQHIGMNVVHLIKGPHGSMVASPVEAKLHIEPDALKPNNEGVVIDYENHHKNHHKVADILED
ncbi:hypothetical protein NQ318_002058, partial [Aromia moschata]